MLKKIVLLLSVLFCISGCVKTPETVLYDQTLGFTEITGYKFHTHIEGNPNAPLIIVVHGGPGADFNYLKSLAPLAKNHRIVFYDQRGNGLSPRVDTSELTIAQNLNDLHDIVEHFSKGNQVKLIGHSWGGMLVSGYLSAFPNNVSHAVIVEPGMLNSESAQAFVDIVNESQSITQVFSLVKYLSAYPFVSEEDGHEGFDYVMTQLLNHSSPGAPYQCPGESMPKNSFTRAGYDAFNTMLKPVMDDPTSFKHNLTTGINHYTGQLMLLSSECSQIGYAFQEKYHVSHFPAQTLHVKAEKMGHNMLTLNAAWSVKTLNQFFEK